MRPSFRSTCVIADARAEMLRGEGQARAVRVARGLHFADLVERLAGEEEGVRIRRVGLHHLVQHAERLVEALLVHHLGGFLDGFPVCCIAVHGQSG